MTIRSGRDPYMITINQAYDQLLHQLAMEGCFLTINEIEKMKFKLNGILDHLLNEIELRKENDGQEIKENRI